MRQLVCLFFCVFGAMLLRAQDPPWPQFRGPTGDGHSSAPSLPLHWSEEQNVKWKTAIHGRAWSSPVVWGDQVWVTTATEDGRQLFAVCIELASGKITRDLKVFEVEKQPDIRQYNTYASPTPVIEAGRIYVTFGSAGTAALDTGTGEVLWRRTDITCNHYRGPGSSPILYGDLLLMDFDGSDQQFVLALDKKTGKTVWRTERSIDYKDLGPDGKPQAEGDFRKAFATPHLAVIEGKSVLLSQGAKAFYAYDPLTGKDLWRVEERTSHSGGTRPLVGKGLVFFPTGFSSGQLLAIRPGRTGEVIDANATAAGGDSVQLKLAWKSKRSVPKKPSLLLAGDLLFMVEDGGIAGCLEAGTGEEVWRERVGGKFSASPLHGAGRIYFFSEQGKTLVIEPGREFRKLAENTLAEGFMASPAVAGKALVLRSQGHLYRIEE